MPVTPNDGPMGRTMSVFGSMGKAFSLLAWI
jgi:hypothetical protein